MPMQVRDSRRSKHLIPIFAVLCVMAVAVPFAGSSIGRAFLASVLKAPAIAAQPIAWQEVAGRRAIQSADRGTTWVRFDDGLEIESGADAKSAGRPYGLATADFDNDGTPDLAVAATDDSSARVRVFRGNLGAVFPNAPEAREAVASGTPIGAPFHLPAMDVGTPVTPEFMIAGDFDGDGNADLAVAESGDDAIFILPGDGRGTFGAARSIAISGTVTTLASGDINRPDARPEILVGAVQGKSAQILVVPGAAVGGEIVVIESPGIVREILVGDVTGARYADILAATSAGVIIAPGLDSAREVPQPVAESVAAGRNVRSIAIGDFSGGARLDVAILREGGSIDLLVGADPVGELSDSMHTPRLVDSFVTAPAGIEHIVAVNASSRAGMDLVGLDRAGVSLSILEGGDVAKADPAAPVAFELTSAPVAVLPMRLNPDASDDLVAVTSASATPSVALSSKLRANFSVTSTADSGPNTLRDAIDQANMLGGADTISFSITGTGPHVINLLSPLPVITGTLDIDGSTEPDFAGTPVIVVNGSGASGANGFDVSAVTNFKLRGVVVQNFTGHGIHVVGGSGAVIEGCYFGTNVAGTTAAANSGGGVVLNGSVGTTLGGTTTPARNVISGNGGQGVRVLLASSALIQGNFIGVTATGNAPLGNALNGVEVEEAVATMVGNGVAGATNVISSNTAGGALSNGVYVHANMTDMTLVSGNIIGLAANGTTVLGNGANGVLNDAPNTLVGGMTIQSRNILSGNLESGVRVESQAFGAIVGGNYIGLDVNGTLDRGNGNDGVWLAGGGVGTVGGLSAGQENTISGNQFHGVKVSGGFSQFVAGNRIGIDPTATVAIPNSIDGVHIAGGAGIGIIQNKISGNTRHGVGVAGGNEIDIGENETALNGSLGIDLGVNGVTANDAGDGDTGAGDLQNFPVITSAVTDGGVTTVMGTINSEPLQDYLLRFYTSPVCDPSGFGEGRVYAGNVLVSTDSMGDAPFSVNLDVAAASGESVTATASLLGFPARPGKVSKRGPGIPINTSEFSQCFAATSLDADLTLSISDTPDPVAAGSNITYTLTANNLGPLPADNATLVLTGPVSTTFQSASAPPGWSIMDPGVDNPGDVTFTNPSFAAGSPAMFTVVVRVNNFTSGGSVINGDAALSSDLNDPMPDNNNDSTTTTVLTSADLSIFKGSNQSLVLPGTDVVYTVGVDLIGPDSAANVTLTDVVPTHMTFQSIDAPPGWSVTTPPVNGTGTITATRSSLGIKTFNQFTITLRLNLSAPGAAIITNTATISSATFDPDSSDNSDSYDFTVDAPPALADLSVSRIASPDPAVRGQDLTYTITVANLGPNPATNVTLTETLPDETSFVSFNLPAGWTQGGGGGGGGGEGTVGGSGFPLTASTSSMEPNTAAIFTVVVNVGLLTADGTSLFGSSVVSSDTPDPDSNNNAVETLTLVVGPPQTDMQIEKTATPTTVTPGSAITYTITATNIGSANAPDVSVTDATPTGTKFVSASASTGGTLSVPPQNGTGSISCTWAGNTPPGQSRTLTIVVDVDDSVEDGTNIVNTASTASLAFETDFQNNTDSATVAVSTSTSVLSADVELTVSPIPTEIDTGEQLVYSMIVRNNGPDTAEDVLLRTSSPLGTRVVSVTSTQGVVASPPPGGIGLVEVVIGDIPSGSAVTVVFTVNVVAEGDEEVQIGIVIESATNDPVAGNNSASGSTEVNAGRDVLLTWDPPLPSDGDERNPPLHLQTQNVTKDSQWPRASKFLELRNTLVGYNIYRSNSPNAGPLPSNFFTSVPAGTTTVVAPTAPGGSFFVVTANYPNGESDGTNDASGGLPEPEIETFQIKGNKIVINGAGFTDDVTVFIDGIPFTKDAKVKKSNTRVQQKGRLLTGQSVTDYLNQQGGVILVSVLNEDTGIGTFLFRR